MMRIVLGQLRLLAVKEWLPLAGYFIFGGMLFLSAQFEPGTGVAIGIFVTSHVILISSIAYAIYLTMHAYTHRHDSPLKEGA
jgi:hypothetical protein